MTRPLLPDYRASNLGPLSARTGLHVPRELPDTHDSTEAPMPFLPRSHGLKYRGTASGEPLVFNGFTGYRRPVVASGAAIVIAEGHDDPARSGREAGHAVSLPPRLNGTLFL